MGSARAGRQAGTMGKMAQGVPLWGGDEGAHLRGLSKGIPHDQALGLAVHAGQEFLWVGCGLG